MEIINSIANNSPYSDGGGIYLDAFNTINFTFIIKDSKFKNLIAQRAGAFLYVK
jgi:hypothetical protein